MTNCILMSTLAVGRPAVHSDDNSSYLMLGKVSLTKPFPFILPFFLFLTILLPRFPLPSRLPFRTHTGQQLCLFTQKIRWLT
ncbi:hypothetical protein GDO78_015122 [Eleutherodactylus coqui]|uniref:Uncharacterized protein n=1 Tax=Eleutherodactylus coqui TaxID=57060 RepID=A0A8J6B2J3_ELECQ|nr:hypothetical protein GDO78_015122 [Eleutherodactylus coqui]